MENEDSGETRSDDSQASSQDGDTTDDHKEGVDHETMEKKESEDASSDDSPTTSEVGDTSNHHRDDGDGKLEEEEGSGETSNVDSPASTQDGNTTNHHKEDHSSGKDSSSSSEDENIEIKEKDLSLNTDIVDSPASDHKEDGGLEIMEREVSLDTSSVDTPSSSQDGNTSNRHSDGVGLGVMEKEEPLETSSVDSPASSQDENTSNHHDEGVDDERETDSTATVSCTDENEINTPMIEEDGDQSDSEADTDNNKEDDNKTESSSSSEMENSPPSEKHKSKTNSSEHIGESEVFKSKSVKVHNKDAGGGRSHTPEKTMSISNFVRVKGGVAVSRLLRRLSMRGDERHPSKKGDDINETREEGVSDVEDEQMEDADTSVEPIPMKGRILLYAKLGCSECKEARQFLHSKRLRYVEINIDVYPSRKVELEKFSGSTTVPKVFFNEVLIGGLSELKESDESGKLKEKIEYVISELPAAEAPQLPLSGEDDESSYGSLDELALVVRRMRNQIAIRDRFHKMRRLTNTFVGSEAVDFLAENQSLEREEAVQFGRNLALNLFFQHVLEENVFEDGNDLYRFLDHDPSISQCHNIPRGIIDLKPNPIADISSRLGFLCHVICDVYTSKGGSHVDYRSIHGSEEFARYLRLVEELQRVDLNGMEREEKMAFFINLYNMMTINAILVWGHPAGALERKKLFGEFKYVIGGSAFSLSDIQNGILRGNQRTPYTLTKTFGAKDKRSTVTLPDLEPLVHFALVPGTRSGPPLSYYSSTDIDIELMEAANTFLKRGGLVVNLNAKTATVNKIFKWFRTDFGKNDNEVLKHIATYMEPPESKTLLELLEKTQFKVVYQPYDWSLNN